MIDRRAPDDAASAPEAEPTGEPAAKLRPRRKPELPAAESRARIPDDGEQAELKANPAELNSLDSEVGELERCDDDGEARVIEATGCVVDPGPSQALGLDAVTADAEPPKKKRRTKRPRTKAERMEATHHEVLDVDGAAEALGVSRRLVLRLLRQGKLPGKKVGREWRLSRTAILQWLKTPETAAKKKDPTWLEAALESGRAELGGERGRGPKS